MLDISLLGWLILGLPVVGCCFLFPASVVCVLVAVSFEDFWFSGRKQQQVWCLMVLLPASISEDNSNNNDGLLWTRKTRLMTDRLVHWFFNSFLFYYIYTNIVLISSVCFHVSFLATVLLLRPVSFFWFVVASGFFVWCSLRLVCWHCDLKINKNEAYITKQGKLV